MPPIGPDDENNNVPPCVTEKKGETDSVGGAKAKTTETKAVATARVKISRIRASKALCSFLIKSY